MIIPDKLNKGDTISIFSPSSPVTVNAPKRFQRAKAFLLSKGFKVLEGSLTNKKDFYRSGTILQRAEELNQLIRNPEVKCMMLTIGGTNSNSILPYIDYEQLMKTPKIIIGYSDVTALLLGIYAKTGLVTYCGPAAVASFGEFAPFSEMTFSYFEEMLIHPNQPMFTVPKPAFWIDEFINWEEKERTKEQYNNKRITINGGSAKGRLIGGKLNAMQGIWGSSYMPEIKEGDILFIEDCLKDIATIERSFSLLKVNGVFDRIGGLILGKHEQFNDLGTSRKPHDVLLEVIGMPNYPVLAEFDFCHTHPMLTLPIGCKAKLDASNQALMIEDKWKTDDFNSWMYLRCKQRAKS